MSAFGYGKHLEKYENVDEEELLATLTTEELQELERELADIEPDDAVPIGLRQQDQTTRSPTGTFSREKLLKYWETDGQNQVGKTTHGQPLQQDSMGESQTDNEEESGFIGGANQSLVLTSGDRSTKKDKADLGTVSGKQRGKCQQMDAGNSYQDHCKDIRGPRKLQGPNGPGVSLDNKASKDEPVTDNWVVVDEVLEMVIANKASLCEVNLNNVRNIPVETLVCFANALVSNTHVQVLSLANTGADDHVAMSVAQMLHDNSTVTTVNMDSNFLSGRGILALMSALTFNCTLVELRFHNQRHVCGSRVEMEMVQLLRGNTSLLKLGYQFELAGPRMSSTQFLTRNQDLQRQLRLQLRLQQEQNSSTQNSAPMVNCQTEENDCISPVTSTTTLSASPYHHSQFVSKLNRNRTPPTRQIARMVRQHQSSSSTTKCETQQKSEKPVIDAENRRNENILLDMKSALKPMSVKMIMESKRKESKQGQMPTHKIPSDLIQAIRSSSVGALRRVREN